MEVDWADPDNAGFSPCLQALNHFCKVPFAVQGEIFTGSGIRAWASLRGQDSAFHTWPSCVVEVPWAEILLALADATGFLSTEESPHFLSCSSGGRSVTSGPAPCGRSKPEYSAAPWPAPPGVRGHLTLSGLREAQHVPHPGFSSCSPCLSESIQSPVSPAASHYPTPSPVGSVFSIPTPAFLSSFCRSQGHGFWHFLRSLRKISI